MRTENRKRREWNEFPSEEGRKGKWGSDEEESSTWEYGMEERC